MAIDQHPSVDAAILASRVPFSSGLYVLGPFAERVSFASQQRRAMTLAWSIHQDLKKAGREDGLRRKEVVVVGAGLAGLTCAVGMGLFDAEVTVYDRQVEHLGEMLKATHRDIHPTINFWPREPVAVSTEFPFFNWYQDSCDKVLKRILEDLKYFQKKNYIIGPNLGYNILNVVPYNRKWKVTIEKADGETFSVFPDIVVLATGFGKEKDLTDSDAGYWDTEKDYIGKIQANNINPFRNYIVSGTGDGAVIEVLRLLFRTFRAGRIEGATAPLVNRPSFAEKIKEIEADIKMRVTDRILHDDAPMDDSFKDEISEDLWPKYLKLVESNINQEVIEAIRKTRNENISHVHLIGRRPTPMEYGAAPYHRLLLTFCIHQGWASYHQIEGSATVVPAGNFTSIDGIAEPIPLKRVTIKAKRQVTRNKSSDRHFAPRRITFKDCLHVIRHGPNSVLQELFTDEHRRKNIRRIQSLYADQDWLSIDQAADYARILKMSPPTDRINWASSLMRLAIDYFYNRHGVEVDLKADSKKYVLIRGSQFQEDIYLANKELIPAKFLGIEVVNRVKELPRTPNADGFDD